MAPYRFEWMKSLLRWWDSWFGVPRHAPRCRSFLRVEPLEPRWVPSTITPTTFADGGLGSGSLRAAVLQLNADTGTADDTIQLLPGTYSLTIRNVGGHHETAGLTGDLNLAQTSHRWIIQGAGPSTIIDASQLQDRVFQIVNAGTQVVFQDLVIQGGLAQDDGSDGALAGTTDALGGGILNNGGDVILNNVVIQDNFARGGEPRTFGQAGYNGRGGGLYCTGGSLTITDSTFANNRATGGTGGPGFYSSGVLHTAPGAGGNAQGCGLYCTGATLSISHSDFANNLATGGTGGAVVVTGGSIPAVGPGGSAQGGGLYVNGGSLTIGSCTVASNEGTIAPGSDPGPLDQGGGLYNAGTLTVCNSTLADNSATATYYGNSRYGGAIYNEGTLTLSNSTVSGNSAIDEGGAVYNEGTLTVSSSTVSSNSSYAGGGIFNTGTLTVSNSTLSGNSNNATGGGSGIFNNGTLTVTNSTLTDNRAGNATLFARGGGIFNNGTLTVSDTTLSSNSAPSGNGGGIYNIYANLVTLRNVTVTGNRASAGGGLYIEGSMVTVTASILSGNSATGYGGGIFSNGTLTVSNSTLFGNSTTGSAPYGSGGGICIFNATSTTLTSVSLSANRASSSGGGLYIFSSTAPPVLHNTLIGGNFRGGTGTTRDDVSGALNSAGDYNLIGDGTGMTGISNGVNGNLVGSAAAPIDPLLGPLQYNGGPTQTMALGAGSPALNAGNPAQLGTTDQRGVVRSGGVNIGAYQASASAFVLSAPDTVQSGVPFDVTVTAVDPFGQVAVGYTGTDSFSTTDADPSVVLPADYQLTLDNGGVHTFTNTGLGETTLITPGPQTLTVRDTADNTIAGSASITVSAAPGPAPRGQRPPPTTLPASPAQTEPPLRRERAAQAVEWWLV